jgi:N-acetylglutamate synthase-like GNAT family acetyltransferase
MNNIEGVLVRIAVPGDLDFIIKKSGLSENVLIRKIEAREIILLIVNGAPVGQIQMGYLWSEIPFIERITIDETFRNRGLSRVLLGFLEDDLRVQGYEALYSSSQMDEPAPQAWHRHMGFEACGVINGLNDGGIGEVFFRKAL